ncbi:hypothetical protein [Colwellia hornerae]|uniref:Porin n=1 Tax=Colwellia hornerae TaxID=89402 RepID=A0A5C6QB23_9GAMM|nr:hypothetical protein [Colwellia hornerae]TWX51108.1 hypothetical protein ESZ28_14425 [Colwellia hornerae]TWX56784.1 hypothetical protein ESZ26_14390 [Colwellia hornerae]TWX66028.1 hypothetical protein ESZ27_11310 [Colwellia hornerae]
MQKSVKNFFFLMTSFFVGGASFASNIVANETENWGDEWSEEVVSPWKFSGFVEAGYGYLLQDNIVESNASLSEINTRVNLDYSHEAFELVSKAELIYDDVLRDTFLQTRELNIRFSPTDKTDVKLGRQILTWGTGDYIFLNDLFAKNWQSFFSGRDDQYLKAPSDSAKGTWYVGNYSLDLTWTPEFTPDIYITGERFSFYSPQAKAIVAPADKFRVEKTNKAQFSARLATNNNGVEYALYGYRGFWPTPVGITENNNQQLQAYFPAMNAWGASVRLPVAGGLFNAEYASYNSIEDNNGTNPFIANGQNRFLVGFESEVIKNLTASVQFYVEQTKHYQQFISHSATPATDVDENRQLLTFRLTYRTLQQKLIYSVFNFYSPTDNDGYLKPSIAYRYNDQWLFSAGANLFWGNEKYTFFGQHQQNSNAWLRVKAHF